MFQFDWASPSLWSRESVPSSPPKTTDAGPVRGTMFIQWQEHCVECSVPHCYSTCNLYVQRKDRKCARLVYGIVRNRAFPGLLREGADMRFRRWGKIEARLTGNFITVRGARLFDGLDRIATAAVNSLGNLLAWADPHRRVNGAFTHYRGRLITKIGRPRGGYDAFTIECYSFEPHPFRLIVELRKSGISTFRQGVEIRPGNNHADLNIPLAEKFSAGDHFELMVYPEGDREVRVVFSWLDFVVRQPASSAAAAVVPDPIATAEAASSAAKVKCVAWDLDNTLWKGILVEDGESALVLRPEAARLIRALDERGIIQTAVSKNNHDDAMKVLKGFGIDQYFLYPAINWGRKSENLQQIADRLNINIDTFALIDDSPFERNEVSTALPMVRVYPEQNPEALLDRLEFDVPVTEASRARRASYLTEIAREAVKEEFGSNYLDFLRSCRLKLRIFRPITDGEIERCLELIQRSNQLNLSSYRYTPGEFRSLLADPRFLCLGLDCSDKFGAYGIVGFASVQTDGNEPAARDFVLSCRVAQKHVEHAFYAWLAERMQQQGARKLLVDLVETSRNKPLIKVFDELPFTRLREEDGRILLAMDLSARPDREDVVELDDSAIHQEAY
jgi:FkbH-like protein